MKSKSITKKKRPSSVLRKAWATRRAKKDLANEIAKSMKPQLTAALQSQDTPTSETETRRSDNAAEANGVNPAFDAVFRTIEMHRDEMLLGFLGDMAAMRRVTTSGHYPVMVSRAQAEAIETFLEEHGYSPWGRRSTAAAGEGAAKAA